MVSAWLCSAGAAAAQHWRDFEKIPYIQGQRRSPSRMVGGAKSRLESYPIPTRDAQRAQTNLCTRTQRPHRKLNNLITWTTALSNLTKL